MGVFEQMYLLKRSEVWARNRLKRVVKTPKLQFIDSGLLTALLDLTPEKIALDRTRFGHVLETFVFGELLKHTTTADGDYRLFYYRDAEKFEVDVVIENAAEQLVGVEVKASATVQESDLRGLKKLANMAGDQFVMGVLISMVWRRSLWEKSFWQRRCLHCGDQRSVMHRGGQRLNP